MPTVELLRIVVASPSDVQSERDSLEEVIAELNHGLLADRGIRLELSRWETDAYPGFHPLGPQGVIDPLLLIEDCDILIGIFWKRFGTPVSDADSGTEHEFRIAFEAWKRHGRPQIMVYFKQKPFTPASSADAAQAGKVLKFREDFPREGLWWPFDDTPEFQKLVRRHLTNFLRERHPVQPSPPLSAGVPTVPPPAAAASSIQPSSSFYAVKREGLEKRLALLQKSWQATNHQLMTTLNPSDKVLLQEQAGKLESEIEQVEAEINRIDDPA